MPVQWLPGTGNIANSYIFGDILVDAGIHPMAVGPYRDTIHTIVLTHCHYDHTAHVVEISHLCNATIAIHQLDAPALRDDFRSVAVSFGERAPIVQPHLLLKEGEQIGPLTVLHTPGHTPGSICLYREEERVLFCGDTVFLEGSFGRYDLPGGDLQALKLSVKRLSELNVEALYPGHGIPALQKGGRHIASANQILEHTYH